LRAVRATPARLLIESLLMPLDALPTKKVHAAVWANEFDRVIGNSIATLTTFDRLLFCH
jgi:hypothetical protein